MARKPPAARNPAPESAAAGAGRSVRIPVRVTPELAERLRDAAWWTREPLTSLVEQAIIQHLDRLEKKLGPFKRRGAEIKPGRRVTRK